mmetsp:Transcript_39751/g.46466  ORF Transcript_39751/g.46466 Transcript_39751/m.46466 type:complete len:96 (+) Transcript_39751:177-464(+)
MERLTLDYDLDNFLLDINKYALTCGKWIRIPSQYVTSVAELLLQLPTINATHRNLLYTQMLNISVAINAIFVTTVPKIEKVPMRGWPVKIKSVFP